MKVSGQTVYSNSNLITISVNTNDTSQNEIDPLEKIDWHDEDFILMESTRNGL